MAVVAVRKEQNGHLKRAADVDEAPVQFPGPGDWEMVFHSPTPFSFFGQKNSATWELGSRGPEAEQEIVSHFLSL